MNPPKVQGEEHNRKRLRCESVASSSNKPYHQLTSSYKTQRLNRVMKELVTEADDRYLASLGSNKEVDEFYAAWMEASIRMTVLSRRNEPSEEIKQLKQEVEHLREKEKKHLDMCYVLETLLLKVKAGLAEDEQAYDTQLASLKTKAKVYKSQRDTAQKDLKFALEELERANKALGEANQRIKELTNHLGQSKAIIIPTFGQMKRALSEVSPDLPWGTLEEKYNAIIADDKRKLKAGLLIVEDDKIGSNNSSGKLSSGNSNNTAAAAASAAPVPLAAAAPTSPAEASPISSTSGSLISI